MTGWKKTGLAGKKYFCCDGFSTQWQKNLPTLVIYWLFCYTNFFSNALCSREHTGGWWICFCVRQCCWVRSQSTQWRFHILFVTLVSTVSFILRIWLCVSHIFAVCNNYNLRDSMSAKFVIDYFSIVTLLIDYFSAILIVTIKPQRQQKLLKSTTNTFTILFIFDVPSELWSLLRSSAFISHNHTRKLVTLNPLTKQRHTFSSHHSLMRCREIVIGQELRTSLQLIGNVQAIHISDGDLSQNLLEF